MINYFTLFVFVNRKWDNDRYMAPDIEAVSALLRSNLVGKQVERFIEDYDEECSSELKPNSPTTSVSQNHKKRNIETKIES